MKESNNSLSIKQSILLLTLLPSLFIAAVLTTYLILSRQSDAQNELLLQANSAITYLAKSSELPLFSGDKAALERLANATIFRTDIKSVTFYDLNGKVLLVFGEEFGNTPIQSINSPYSEETVSHWIFQTPVFNTELDVDDFNDNEDLLGESKKQQKYLGWIQIVADKTPLLAKKRSILYAGVGIASFLFGLLALIALNYSRSITFPLGQLIKTVRELESGNLHARILVSSKGELKELADGVNQLADKVKISNDGLKIKINEATQKLTLTLSELEARNIELEVTGNELVKASNVKDEFLASVSHELRTPLTSIIGYTELLKKAKLEVKQETQVDTIYQASKILLHLIENILDFSKLKSESLDLEYIPFNLKELLDEVTSLHLPAAKAKNVILKLVVDINSSVDLIGDPSRLEQILNNFVQNAIKFTEQGTVKISVSSFDDNSGLLFSVKDTGIGMDVQNQSGLFEPFNQLDSSISRRFGGTGLGLVICKKLVSQFGGTIEIKSEKGSGTEVTFSIKNIYRNEVSNSPEITFNEKTETPLDDESLAGRLIIVAEDNSFVQKLLIGIFENEGARVIAVDDGFLALEAIKKQKPDLLVLDYQMPFLDGIRTCEKVRGIYSEDDLPVVLLTADVININNTMAKDVGVNQIIYKPIVGDELVVCARKLISCENINKIGKVLDGVSEDILKDELNRLKKIISTSYKSKDYISLKKHIHQLCGIAGSSSENKQIWEIAKELDAKLNSQEYDCLEEYIFKINKISI